MITLKEIIESRPELYETDAKRKHNRLIDPVWRFYDATEARKDDGSSDPVYMELDFRDFYDELSPRDEILIKQVLQPSNGCMPGQSIQLEDGSIMISRHNFYGVPGLLRSFVTAKFHIKGDAEFLSLTAEELQAIWREMLHVRGHSKQQFPGLRAFSEVKKIRNLLAKIYHAYQIGQLIDGLNTTLDTAFAFEHSVREHGNTHFSDFDYAAWKKGGDLSGLPVYQSMALLMSCIEFLRSDRTKTAIALLRAIHKAKPSSPHRWIRKLNDGQLLSVGSRTNSPKSHNEIIKAELQTLFPRLTISEIKKKISNIQFERQRGQGGSSEFKLILPAIPTVVALVLGIITGARRNELESIRWDDIYRGDDGTWRFKSAINKTNFGLPTVRYIGGIAAEAVDVMKLLNEYINPCFSGELLRIVWSNHKFGCNAIGKETTLKHYQDRIDRFINPLLDDDLKIKDFNYHSLRHAWAEFALRRFEGDSVPELIRQHFRHYFGSYMTKRYIQGKLNEEDGIDLQKNYIRELIGRVAEGQERFYGPVADFIQKAVNEMKFIGEDELETLTERFNGTIEAHEYGFCVVRPETVATAQCYDKSTLAAKTEDACWEKCGGCVNRLTMPSQRADILRLGQSIQASVRSFEKANLIPLVDSYKLSLQRAQTAIAEIDAGEQSHA